MAIVPPEVTIQVVNVDLVPARQKILRGKLRELFKSLNNRSRSGRKELIYTLIGEDADVNKVLRSNPSADALFTGFKYDAIHSEDYKKGLTVEAEFDIGSVAPELRYPVIADYRKHIDQGGFRHRKLVLVGDIHEKLAQVLRADLPVRASYYANDERTEVTPPAALMSLDGGDGNGGGEGGFDLSRLHNLWIADIKFDSVIHMPEEANKFVFKDNTIVSTIRLLFTMEAVREVMTREFLQEERLTFVRGKRVFMLLDPDLEHVISERLTFDRMQNLHKHHTLEEAMHTLETGRSQSIIEYFELQGYGVIFEALDQEERDKFLIAVLGDKLVAFLEKEIQSQKSVLLLMDESDLESVLYNLPETLLNSVLDAIKNKAYEKYLALFPPKIREGVILSFVGDVKYISSVWQGIEAEERTKVLDEQAAQILAALNLVNDKLFKARFSDIPFEFGKNYSSASLATMSEDEQQSAFALFAKSLSKLKLAPGIIASQLSQDEVASIMKIYIKRQPGEFYNRLNALVRKQLWIKVAKEFKDHIGDELHFLDKAAILKGNKELTINLLFSDKTFTAELALPENRAMAAALFLILKRSNKVESKTALLRKVLGDSSWEANRRKGVPDMLEDPENEPTYKKLSEHVEGLEFVFDSAVCTREHYEQIKHMPPIANASVILVDDLVDASLFNLFEKGNLSKEEYDQFSQSVDEEIAAIRESMAAHEVDDPVGVYLLESMQVLHQMSNQAVVGKLNPEMLDQLDDRRHVRQRLIDSLALQLKKIDEFLANADNMAKRFEEKLQKTQALQDRQSRQYDIAYKNARGLMANMQTLQEAKTKALSDKKKVALTQKELSLQFFELIHPLILEKVKSLGSPIAALMKVLGFKKEEPDVSGRRVIFKFTDEEIKNILRFNIVFCTKDDILMQFIVTCLRIDNLQDSLFSLGTLENLPKDGVDILFYGPGYELDDFAGYLKENRIVRFADEAFIKRLLGNEKFKARTKSVILKSDQEMKIKKKALEDASQLLKAQHQKQAQITNAIESLKKEQGKLQGKLETQAKRKHRLLGEQELLETRLEEVDSQFEQIKSQVAELMPEGAAGTLDQIDAAHGELADKLRDDLVAMNKKLARMMYIKGVTDAGDQISKNTQDGIIKAMELRDRYSFKDRPFNKLIAADDGSARSKNIKRIFLDVARQYFRRNEMVIEDVNLKRLEGRSEISASADYPFIVLITDQPEDKFAEIRRLVKKIRSNMPETYQLVIMPFGQAWKYPPDSEDLKNLRSVKDNSALVNSAIIDLQDPQSMLKMLAEKAPLG